MRTSGKPTSQFHQSATLYNNDAEPFVPPDRLRRPVNSNVGLHEMTVILGTDMRRRFFIRSFLDRLWSQEALVATTTIAHAHFMHGGTAARGSRACVGAGILGRTGPVAYRGVCGKVGKYFRRRHMLLPNPALKRTRRQRPWLPVAVSSGPCHRTYLCAPRRLVLRWAS
jgi:hypothetical protein